MKINERDRAQGNSLASLILVEYGDYECIHCSAAHRIIKKLQQHFGSRLMYVFRNFPLTTIHPNAITAAYLAEAAGLQGKFWSLHDIIFEQQDKVSKNNLVDYASMVGTDAAQLLSDANSYKVKDKVEKDIDSGEKSGVNKTPTFFINGRRYNGSYNYEDLLEVLDFRY